MESFGHERKVQQGEDWNLDILLSASDVEYIPFIVSSERKNPFFVITIASTKYEKNHRYVQSWWCSVDDDLKWPRFYSTVPVDCGDVSYPDSDIMIPNKETWSTRCLYQYTYEDDEVDLSLGHKPYHYMYRIYWDTPDHGDRYNSEEDQYEPRLRFNFLSPQTAEWGSQNYMYQITLVSGQLMHERLREIYLAHDAPDTWPVLPEDLNNWSTLSDVEKGLCYDYVKLHWPNDFQPDIDRDSPLGTIEHPEPVLPPTKLEVFNNLRTII